MEKGKFYFDEVKKNNVKFIKLFKRSKADNFMYNGEYTKMKKFYRGMMYGNFFYDNEIYSSRSSKEITLFQRYETKVWQNFCDTVYTTLRKWNKENIKAGKRPVQDTEEYKEKRLQRALLTDIGTCGYCEREQEIENGVIYDHGFTVGNGYRNNVCYGAGMRPYERSPEAKELLVKHLAEKIDFTKSQEPNQTSVDFYNGDQFKYTQTEIDELAAKSRFGAMRKVGDWKVREFLNAPVYNQATLEKLTDIFNNTLDFQMMWLTGEEAKLKKWEAVPTYREQALARKNK